MFRNYNILCIQATFCLGLMGMSLKPVHAQSGVVRVEEDWELVVTQPDSQLNAPQVVIVLKPLGANSDLAFEVDFNHASVPTYQAGGYQLRAVKGNDCLSHRRFLSDQRITATSDVIRWTQVVERQSPNLTFAVVQGTSNSWGSFGAPNEGVTIPSAAPNLNYSPQDSLNNTGVTYAANRVGRLTLVRVRLIDAQGQTTELQVNQSVQ